MHPFQRHHTSDVVNDILLSSTTLDFLFLRQSHAAFEPVNFEMITANLGLHCKSHLLLVT